MNSWVVGMYYSLNFSNISLENSLCLCSFVNIIHCWTKWCARNTILSIKIPMLTLYLSSVYCQVQNHVPFYFAFIISVMSSPSTLTLSFFKFSNLSTLLCVLLNLFLWSSTFLLRTGLSALPVSYCPGPPLPSLSWSHFNLEPMFSILTPVQYNLK